MLRYSVGNNLLPHSLMVLLVGCLALGEGKLVPMFREYVKARQVGFTPKLLALEDGFEDGSTRTFHVRSLAQARNLSSNTPQFVLVQLR